MTTNGNQPPPPKAETTEPSAYRLAVNRHWPELLAWAARNGELWKTAAKDNVPIGLLFAKNRHEGEALIETTEAIVADLLHRLNAAAAGGGSKAVFEEALVLAVRLAVNDALIIGFWAARQGLAELPDKLGE